MSIRNDVRNQFVPGDVVYFAAGPLESACAVVRHVDDENSELTVTVPLRSGHTHTVHAHFNEVEWP